MQMAGTNIRKALVAAFLLIAFVPLSFGQRKGQVRAGKIVYERRTNLFKKFTDPRTREWIKEKDKIRNEDFALYFNDTCAIFKPIYSEEADPLMWTTTKNTVYQNKNTDEKLTILSFAGQEAYVKDTMAHRRWQVTESKRIIAGYECRKAVWQKNDSTRLYAWFCLEIEPTFGPEGFDGLPGMILGLATEDGGVIYFAKSVEVMNPPKEQLEIELKKKKVFSMPELKAKIEKDFGDSDWGKRLFDDLFRWL